MVSHDVKLEVMGKTSKFQKSTFVKNLILRRKQMGMSALEFSEFAKIKYPTLRDIEHGSSAGSLKTLQKIAKALNTTIDALHAPATQSANDSKSDLIVSIMQGLPSLNEDQLACVLRIVTGHVDEATPAVPATKTVKSL